VRQEGKNWWRQAEADLLTAKKLLEVERWYGVAFFSQQAAEKAYLKRCARSGKQTNA